MYAAIVSRKNGNYLTFYEVATICAWSCHHMYAAIASRKNGNYLTFNCVFESFALISSQPSDGWLGSASYYIFQVENFWIYFYCIIDRADSDVYSLPYRLLLTGIFLNRIITQDFSVIFKFLCKLFLVIIAQQFWADSDGFPAPTITPCWFLHCGTFIPPVLHHFSCRRVGLLYPEHEYNFEAWWKDTRYTVSWQQAT